MKRRAFLQITAAGLALPVLPAAACFGSRPIASSQRILVIGAGGIGVLATSVLTRYPECTHRTFDYLGADMDRASAGLKRRGLPVAIVSGQGCASVAAVAKHMGTGSHQHQHTAALLLAALGGRAGTRLVEAIAEVTRDVGLFTVATFALPAHIEDRTRALEVLPKLQQSANFSMTVDFADIMTRSGVSRPEFCQSSACLHALADSARKCLTILSGNQAVVESRTPCLSS